MGKITCVVRSCSSKTGEGIGMFKFPNDAVRTRIWLKACNREDLLFKNIENLSVNYKVCGLHFDPKYVIENKTRKKLLEEAIPSIFVGIKRQGNTSYIFEETKKGKYVSDIPQKMSDPCPSTSNQTASGPDITICYPELEVEINLRSSPLLAPSIPTQTIFSSPRKKKLKIKIQVVTCKFCKYETDIKLNRQIKTNKKLKLDNLMETTSKKKKRKDKKDKFCGLNQSAVMSVSLNKSEIINDSEIICLDSDETPLRLKMKKRKEEPIVKTTPEISLKVSNRSTEKKNKVHGKLTDILKNSSKKSKSCSSNLMQFLKDL